MWVRGWRGRGEGMLTEGLTQTGYELCLRRTVPGVGLRRRGFIPLDNLSRTEGHSNQFGQDKGHRRQESNQPGVIP